MSEKLIVSSSPHFQSKRTTHSIMLDVIIALCPALVASIILYGIRSLILTAVTVACCVLFEYLFRKAIGRDNSTGDLSAIVTGMLLAFNLPVTFPYWMAAVGAAVAIIAVKEFFGGLGQNFANPAMVARIVLMLSFTSQMTSYFDDTSTGFARVAGIDVVATATPLAQLQSGEIQTSITELLLGLHGGCLGESCAIALILGGIYLVVRRVISPTIPVCYIGTVGLLSLIAGQNALYMMLSGGLLLGAVFMATDYVTSPITTKGKIIFGIGCGIITFIIRSYAAGIEGVSFAIVIMNLLVPQIDKLTGNKPFGGEANV